MNRRRGPGYEEAGSLPRFFVGAALLRFAPGKRKPAGGGTAGLEEDYLAAVQAASAFLGSASS
jgi:hypothetical protein